MAQSVIVDTDILIDFGLDRPDAVQTMAKLEENYTITVSVISGMELYAGIHPTNYIFRLKGNGDSLL
ncbi:MAG: hypothetical protein LAT80_03220, partial [Balneolaceae bacterium]|nr:hypothetical protein [Balneolaceae bacterium]